MIRWRVGDQLYPVQHFAERFRRPDLIARILRRELPPDASPDSE